MKKLNVLFSALFLSMTAITACQSPSESSAPSAVITRKMELKGIPSASGIERVGNQFYVIGDDSPYLFCLNAQYEIIQKTALLASSALQNGRIPKPVKPDLEAITSLALEGQPYLLVLGSGSTDKRNHAYLVPISSQGAGAPQAISLASLYKSLSTDTAVVGGASLNIEGVAADEEYLYLLHRFSPQGHNAVLIYTMASVSPFLQGRAAAPKPYKVQTWALPDLENIKTGFSGVASALGGKLLFTASAEETPNAVLDGEVYGSMVGWLNVYHTSAPQPSRPSLVSPITEANGTSYKGKIESISVLKNTSERSLTAVAVADSDDGLSELIELEFNW
ncbi:DUF6929 family protein [Rufibacter quisquiliarum]|uniref:Uncharacterized protein n=1 Tax=Rufibacter quisquiliarum TaxID=1549639 RepID=A0A839GM47_9BACT|nr:hypothetical protein [Rufibacter quisquiliarum]MBA9076645.1 hypothetical protein [Rufibacter quisquiliarum]